MKSPWREWESCPQCGNREFLFEPYTPKNILGVPLFIVYHRGSEEIRCFGRCGTKSGCPYCNGSLEMGKVICAKRGCPATYVGMRICSSGKVLFLPDTINADLSYAPNFTVSRVCLN